ncbi:winged helix domain-containing protein [Streptomyces sp. NPDC005820]|uniref:winged helix domain-containing protein n=1 Tax=Streptomyces sp. NPDC005820 TaxID=3157069 RepID=UPI0033DD3F3A
MEAGHVRQLRQGDRPLPGQARHHADPPGPWAGSGRSPGRPRWCPSPRSRTSCFQPAYIEDPSKAPTEPVVDLVLWPGDVLYVPRGVWHAVSADQGTRSLHVTCGLQTHTATDLMAWVSAQLLTHEGWRRDLPLLAAPDVQADAVDGMRKRLAEPLDDPTLLARYQAAMDGQAVGRMVPSLPYIDTVPTDGGLRVRLTTARAVLDVGEDTVTLSAAGTVHEFAPEAEAVLRPLVDGRTVDLAALADMAGLALEDVAALVQELVAGQAAVLGSLL